jgi:hypothetical protein
MMIPLIALWCLMAVAVLVLAVMRKMAAKDENEVIHVDDVAFANKQAAIAARLEKIDHWGKIVTAVCVVFGLCLCAVYLYNGWKLSQTIQ